MTRANSGAALALAMTLLCAPASAQSFLPGTVGPDASIIFRDYNTDGVAASGPHNILKGDLRQWGAAIGDALQFTLDARSEFHAKGDNSTNNTTALQNAINAAQSLGVTLYIPGGPGVTYKTDKLTYAYGQNYASIICQPGTVIQKATADGNVVIQIGTPSQAGYLGPIKDLLSGCDVRGIPGDTPNAVVSYDIANAFIDRVSASGATEAGWKSFGGVSNIWNFPRTTNNAIGIEFTSFSRSGGGVPNQNVVNFPLSFSNSVWGLYFEDGNFLTVNWGDIEQNGNGNNGAGGIYCAPVSTLTGCVINGTWLEQNNGRQGLWLNGGHNVVRDLHSDNNPSILYDALVTNGGTYTFENWNCGLRTTNIYDAGSSGPNAMQNMGACANWVVNSAITSVTGELPSAWTPTIACSSGSMTTGTVVAKTWRSGFSRFFTLIIPITSIGTCASYISATLPTTPTLTTALSVVDTAHNVAGQAAAQATVGTIYIRNASGSLLGQDASNIVVSGSYE